MKLSTLATYIAIATPTIGGEVLSPLDHGSPAHVTPNATPAGWLEGDYLTGNWGGFRDRLKDSGIEFFGYYNSIFSGNVVGGLDSGHSTYVQDAWVGFNFDLDKLVGWKGGEFLISGINRTGPDLTGKYIGSTYSVQQMVGGQQPFLYQVCLKQQLSDDLAFKVGRFGASDDFNSSPLYGYSLNNAINGNIRNVLYDTRFSSYPFAVWAAALLYEREDYFVKAGIFQTSDDMFDPKDHGLDFGINSDDGYTAIVEVGLTPEINGKPGHYWLGATFSAWDYYERFDGGFEDQSYGLYAHADQMVYRESKNSDQGLTLFAAAGYYPQEEISIVPFQINLGLNYKGLIPGRDNDRSMLHFVYGKLSDDYAEATLVPGGNRAESEKVLEAAHRFQITPWCYFQPDVQWVIDPGGTGDIDNALVIGAQMGFTF